MVRDRSGKQALLRQFGVPYEAFNPYHVWLMVVLVSGVSLAGYLALRFVGPRGGLVLTGLLGGLISSTATTLVFSRQTRHDPATLPAGTRVILLSNLMVPGRLAVMIGLTNLQVLNAVWPALVGCSVLGGLVILVSNRILHTLPQSPPTSFANPTQLKVALGFGTLYAVVLFLTAWVSSSVGAYGYYAVAFVSGLTDMDAITLSSVQMATLETIPVNQAAFGVLTALAANMILKSVLIFAFGGRALMRGCAPGLAAMVAGVILGIAAL